MIDKNGVLQYMGGIDSIPSAKVEDIAKATPYFANAAKAVLAGQAPDPAVTPPIGSSIKSYGCARAATSYRRPHAVLVWFGQQG